jgi:energy-coupling factor transport system permease protein
MTGFVQDAGRGYHRSFSRRHPAVALVYIASAIVCTMCAMQPVYLAISFAAGTAVALFLSGSRRYLSTLRPLAALFVLIVVINPLTNRRGGTVLFTIFDAPVTAEALAYGVCAGVMLMSVIVWFQSYRSLITNDRFMFLFGRAAPTSALVVSMIMKFIPVMSVKLRETLDAQRALGVGASDRALGARVFGILISRGMEDSIETADAMRARGYGSGSRTLFVRYRLKSADCVSLCALAALLAANLFFVIAANAFGFFPYMHDLRTDFARYLPYALMLLWPFLDEAVDRVVFLFDRAARLSDARRREGVRDDKRDDGARNRVMAS